MSVSTGRDNLIGGTNPGEGNVIAFNSDDGVLVLAFDRATRASILGNSIFENNGIGIDLGSPSGPQDNDPGDLDGAQNYPVLTAATIDGGRRHASASQPPTSA